MRRDFGAQIARFARRLGLQQLVQLAELGLQKVDLLLLAKYRAIELFDLVFGQAQLDFEFGDSGLHAGSPLVQR